MLRDLHKLLMETHVIEGKLCCANCGHEYQIKEGIANFLLPSHLGEQLASHSHRRIDLLQISLCLLHSSLRRLLLALNVDNASSIHRVWSSKH